MHTLIYGRQPVREVLRAGRREVMRLFVAEGVRPSLELDAVLALAKERGVKTETVDNYRLGGFLESGAHHQGLVVETGGYPYVEVDEMVTAAGADAPSGAHRLILLLDRIQDPQNLGSILRTADGAGVAGVVLPKEKAAHVTPAVVRASSGASEHMRVAIEGNLVRVMDRLAAEGYTLVGLDDTPDAVELRSYVPAPRIALAIGSEGSGLRKLMHDRCDVVVRIPMAGKVNSLNAAIAGAVAMFHMTA